MQDDDDIQLQGYQDDLTTDDNATDPIMDEENDDPTEELGIPPEEFKEELDKEDFGDHNESGDDDRREDFEDREKDDSRARSNSFEAKGHKRVPIGRINLRSNGGDHQHDSEQFHGDHEGIKSCTPGSAHS